MKLTVRLPNLSLSRGQLPTDMASGGRARLLSRKVRNLALWAGVFLFFFVSASVIALPTQAVAWRISHLAKSKGYLIDIEDVSVYPWGTVTLENVTWTFEPSRPDMPPQQYFMEKVDVSVGLFALLGGAVDVEVETAREMGRIRGHYLREEGDSTIRFEIEDLPLYDVPKATQVLNVPLTGVVAMRVDLTLPKNKLSKAKGTIDITCAACTAGDGESKLYVPGSKFKNGLKLPQVNLGTITGKIGVEKGLATIEETIDTQSEDLTMSLEGSLKLKDDISKSRLKMFLKVELSESFQERAEAVRWAYQSATTSKLSPPERGLGFRIEGFLNAPKLRGANTKTRAEKDAERRERYKEAEARRRERRARLGRGKRGDDDPSDNQDEDTPTMEFDPRSRVEDQTDRIDEPPRGDDEPPEPPPLAEPEPTVQDADPPLEEPAAEPEADQVEIEQPVEDSQPQAGTGGQPPAAPEEPVQ